MPQTVETREAFDAWHTARQELREATPWTAAWQRLRVVEEELRSEYLAFVDDEAEVDHSQTPKPRTPAG